MKKLFLLCFLILLFLPKAFGLIAEVCEDDGTDCTYPYSIRFPVGNITDNADGTVNIADNTGAGGGDEISVNGTAATNANFIDNIYMDFVHSTAPSPDTVEVKHNYALTLAGNHAFAVDECAIGADTSGGFLICEGSTADTNEQLYRLPDANGADTTEYIVVADDANVSAAEAGYLDGVTSAIQTQIDGKEGTLSNEAGLYSALSDVSDFTQPGVAETISANWVNTANPWAANEGGTGGDSSAATGIARVDSGTWSYSELSGEVTTSGSNAATIADTGVALTSLTVGSLLGVDSIDATGAVDMDYGSADVTDHTFTTDGGTVILDGQISSSQGSTAAGLIKILEDTDDGSNFTAFTVQAQAGDVTYTLPAADGSSGQQLQTNGSGTLSWAAAGGSGGGRTNLTLRPQEAKITGDFVTHTPAGCSTTASTAGASIDGGDGSFKLLYEAGDTPDLAAVWQFVMPDNYSSAPVLDVHFAMTSGESDKVEFEGAIMCYTPTTDTANIDTASFANCAVGTATTVSATAGEVYSQSITLNDDSPACAAGDDVWVWLSTDADDPTNDGAAGDREVIHVEFSYTA